MLIWTVNFVVAKVALAHLPAMTLASFRVVCAGLLMLVISAFWRTKPDSTATRLPQGRREILQLALLGLLGVAGNQMLFTIGLSHTTVGHSALIIGAGPISTLLLARLMRLELLTVRKLAGMVLCFCGVVILALEKGLSLSNGTLKGDLITWTGSLSFCLYTVFGKKLAPHYDTFRMNLYMYIAGGLIALPLAVREGLKLDWGRVGWQGWAGMLYMAGLASVLAYLIYYWALRHLAASRLAAFTYLQPMLATLLGVMVLGEPVTPNLIWGGSLVVVGVYLAERRRRLAKS